MTQDHKSQNRPPVSTHTPADPHPATDAQWEQIVLELRDCRNRPWTAWTISPSLGIFLGNAPPANANRSRKPSANLQIWRPHRPGAAVAGRHRIGCVTRKSSIRTGPGGIRCVLPTLGAAGAISTKARPSTDRPSASVTAKRQQALAAACLQSHRTWTGGSLPGGTEGTDQTHSFPLCMALSVTSVTTSAASACWLTTTLAIGCGPGLVISAVKTTVLPTSELAGPETRIFSGTGAGADGGR